MNLFKVMKTFFREIDYTDTEYNSRLLKAFSKSFYLLERRRTEHFAEKAYFSAPLHRIFAYYLQRLIVKNAMIIQQSRPDLKPDAVL